MGEIKGFRFAVRHGEILMTDLGLILYYLLYYLTIQFRQYQLGGTGVLAG